MPYFKFKSELREELHLSPSTFRNVLKDLNINTGRQKILYPSQVELIRKKIKTHLPAYAEKDTKQVA